MHCREFESRLNDILDDRGQPRADSQLAAHADGCDPCRQLLDGQQALFAGLKHRPLPATSLGFAGRVVAQAAPAVASARGGMQPASNVPKSKRMLWALATVLGTAAAVLLVVSLVWQARRANAPLPENNVVEHKPSVPVQKRSPSGFAMSQANWLIEAPRLPSRIRGSYRGTIDDLAIALPETVQRLDEVEHLAPGIRPIRISFGVLFEALWRTLPGTHGDEPPTRTSYHAIDLRQLA